MATAKRAFEPWAFTISAALPNTVASDVRADTTMVVVEGLMPNSSNALSSVSSVESTHSRSSSTPFKLKARAHSSLNRGTAIFRSNGTTFLTPPYCIEIGSSILYKTAVYVRISNDGCDLAAGKQKAPFKVFQSISFVVFSTVPNGQWLLIQSRLKVC